MHPEVRHLDHSAAHRSTRSELLVSDLRQRSADQWEVSLSLPRSHWLCHPTPMQVPLTLTVEALRQAGLAVCIAGYDMDPTARFLISAISVHTEPEQLVFPRFGAFEGIATVSFSDIVYRKGRLHRLEVDYEIGTAVAAHISAQVLTDADYRVIRRHAHSMGEFIVERGESLLTEVVVTNSGALATLGVNEADPFFFDHAVDHLPGMLLLHAATALHQQVAGAAPADLDITFPAFAELRTPTRLHARLDHLGSRTTITQGERTVAEVSARCAERFAQVALVV
jgi:2-oxo-3-(phosphooxy)propyl 3-oxoalkanoate synthase